jgi:hypothetical protein
MPIGAGCGKHGTAPSKDLKTPPHHPQNSANPTLYVCYAEGKTILTPTCGHDPSYPCRAQNHNSILVRQG